MIMAVKISKERVEETLAYAKEQVPDLEIIYKDEPYPTLWIKFVFMWASLIGFFSKDFKTKWETQISNALAPKYIIFPSRKTHSDLQDYGTYSVFRHELVHLIDARKWGFWFNLTYVLLPLPILLAGRAHWEYRAFVQNLVVWYETFGRLPESRLTWIASHYSGSLYFYMWPWKKDVMRRWEATRQKILSGEIKGHYPDVSWWKI